VTRVAHAVPSGVHGQNDLPDIHGTLHPAMRIIGTFQRKGAIHDRFEDRSAGETIKPMSAEALYHRVLLGVRARLHDCEGIPTKSITTSTPRLSVLFAINSAKSCVR
jgi:hypothetical protein